MEQNALCQVQMELKVESKRNLSEIQSIYNYFTVILSYFMLDLICCFVEVSVVVYFSLPSSGEFKNCLCLYGGCTGGGGQNDQLVEIMKQVKIL